MNNLLKILNKYLELLQEQNASDEDITEVKLLIWAIEDDIKLQRYIRYVTWVSLDGLQSRQANA